MAANEQGLRDADLSKFTIRPRNLTQYTAYRGVTDFTNIGQFAQYESGYICLSVLQTPEFINQIGAKKPEILKMQNSFVHMLEYEFRGIDGLPDMTTDTMEITDGNNTVRLINNVTWDTAITVNMSYFEKTGSLISKYAEYYLTGIKDRMSKTKTYHGAIRSGLITPGPENEVFTFLVYVTDATMLRLERAVLLCNCQLTQAPLSNYNGQKGSYENKEVSLEFNCFPVMGDKVDAAASVLLKDITGTQIDNTQNTAAGIYTYTTGAETAQLDSFNYTYGIMNDQSKDYLASLTSAISEAYRE